MLYNDEVYVHDGEEAKNILDKKRKKKVTKKKDDKTHYFNFELMNEYNFFFVFDIVPSFKKTL